ncbi:MAG: hypothetical protein K0R73_1095 [Candidatus Midichloriaceae bacterium]|nr:hypothetical protein [Candidatus Midichloriaceae bacterium]
MRGIEVDIDKFISGIKDADEINYYLDVVKDLADIYAADANNELWRLGDWYINVAGIALVYHKMETFDILVKRIPTLMFRTAMDFEDGSRIFSKTPLDIAAVRFISPHFVSTILSHEALRSYATKSPEWYTQMVSTSLELAIANFVPPMTDNQLRVIRLLEGALIQR